MQENKNEICIGIDLGTTNSEVAVVQKGKVVVLKIDHARIMPSVVSMDGEGNILVGKAAVNNELVAPENTIRLIKRKMGREEVIPLNGLSYTPQMISSLILQRLKQAAEEFLGCAVHKAVITVPAFFNEKQREATKEAAELAGLELLRLLNEPTAAALAYSLGQQKNERCLIYDLGGGTFDVSIVDFSEQIMEVKASHGDTELGGADFDKLIAERVRQAFQAEYGIDLSQNPVSWIRLMRAAEGAKIRLSTEPLAEILEEFIAEKEGSALHLKYRLSRTEFEQMLRPTLQRSLTSVQKAMEMAGMNSTQLDRVILVGGSTFIPLVKQLLEEHLYITPQAWISPAMVVAMGAAIEAAKLNGEHIGPMMVDVTPHSLGVECWTPNGKVNDILIRRNTPLPHIASQVVYKMHEEQRQVEIIVYQGEFIQPHLNQLLGSFKLEGLTSTQEDIHLKLELDRSGLLHVTATEIATGKKSSETLKKASRSRIKHANLAQLETIRISTKTLVLEENEQDQVVQCNAFEDDEEYLATEVASEGLEEQQPASEQSELLKRAQGLLLLGKLDAIDQADLANHIELANTGEKAALDSLSDLIYYLE